MGWRRRRYTFKCRIIALLHCKFDKTRDHAPLRNIFPSCYCTNSKQHFKMADLFFFLKEHMSFQTGNLPLTPLNFFLNTRLCSWGSSFVGRLSMHHKCRPMNPLSPIQYPPPLFLLLFPLNNTGIFHCVKGYTDSYTTFGIMAKIT